MIENDNPVLQKIQEQELKIIYEVELKKKKNSINMLVVYTSLILLLGMLIGLIRILIIATK